LLDVTVYSLPVDVCIRCRAVEIAMRRRGIDATKVMLNEDAEAMAFIKGLGYAEAPVTVVRENGKIVDHWANFSDTKIEKLMEKVPA
jgi:glutaredoxin-like protein NrdH